MFVFGQTQKCYTDGFLQSLQQTDPAKYEKMRAAQTDLLFTNAKITDDIYMIPVVVSRKTSATLKFLNRSMSSTKISED